jgi:hypothetical protein
MSDSNFSRRALVTRTGAILGAAAVASLPGATLLATPASAAPRTGSAAPHAATKGPSYSKTPRGENIKAAYRRVQKNHERVHTGRTSLNGWGTEKVINGGGNIWTRPVPGTPSKGVAVRIGVVETVLVHVVQRFHYDVERISEDGVIGWQHPANVTSRQPQGNQASGTAVRIRPDLYPAGTTGNFFGPQVEAIRAILAEADGTVAWGGDDATPDEALFYIAVKPGNSHLTDLAARLNRW